MRRFWVVVYLLGVMLVNILTELSQRGKSDLFVFTTRNFFGWLLSWAIPLTYAWVTAEIGLNILDTIDRRVPNSFRHLILIIVVSVAVLWLGNAVAPLMSMLVQIPRLGLEYLYEIVLSMAFVLGESLLTALIIGGLLGFVYFRYTSRKLFM
jgi:hypothetical protein